MMARKIFSFHRACFPSLRKLRNIVYRFLYMKNSGDSLSGHASNKLEHDEPRQSSQEGYSVQC